MAYLNTSSAPTSSIAALAASLINRLRSRVAKYFLYRSTFNELSALSNRGLADLGLDRSELRRLALESAYPDAR